MTDMHVAPRLVVLVRHGKAESGKDGQDHARRLTSRGASDASDTGRWLAAQLGPGSAAIVELVTSGDALGGRLRDVHQPGD